MITLEEALKDKEDTERDIECLENIVNNLGRFIYQPGGEERSAYKVDHVKYQHILAKGRQLLVKINIEILNLQVKI